MALVSFPTISKAVILMLPKHNVQNVNIVNLELKQVMLKYPEDAYIQLKRAPLTVAAHSPKAVSANNAKKVS